MLCFIQFWGSNPGPCACWANSLITELHSPTIEFNFLKFYFIPFLKVSNWTLWFSQGGWKTDGHSSQRLSLGSHCELQGRLHSSVGHGAQQLVSRSPSVACHMVFWADTWLRASPGHLIIVSSPVQSALVQIGRQNGKQFLTSDDGLTLERPRAKGQNGNKDAVKSNQRVRSSCPLFTAE